MSTAHLQQILLHETPVGPTAQVMAPDSLVPYSFLPSAMEASFSLCCIGFFYLMDSLVCMRNALVFLPDLHKAQSTHKAGCDLALQDGNCQHLWHMSWSLQLWFVTVSRFSPALKTVRSSQMGKKTLCFIHQSWKIPDINYPHFAF